MFYSLNNLRNDGRKKDEIRHLKCFFQTIPRGDGSVLLKQGLTKVLVVVNGPKELINHPKSIKNESIISCKVNQAPFSTTKRQFHNVRNGQNLMLANFIENTFNHVIVRNSLQRSQIEINIQILQTDGSILSSCICAVNLALIHASIPILDFICSCSVGFKDGHTFIDLNHQEEKNFDSSLEVVFLSRTSEILTTRIKTKNSRLDEKTLEKMLLKGKDGCRHIKDVLSSDLKEYIQKIIKQQQN